MGVERKNVSMFSHKGIKVFARPGVHFELLSATTRHIHRVTR